ncbi:hypothetical protein WJX73_006964 [Symbiochloris irregularis]|uniref:Uncharacterized protein n=1 Tax=Symbiochloris irregularis TaxID=706552 RepID=A0AAW1Q092_9CHLO
MQAPSQAALRCDLCPGKVSSFWSNDTSAERVDSRLQRSCCWRSNNFVQERGHQREKLLHKNRAILASTQCISQQARVTHSRSSKQVQQGSCQRPQVRAKVIVDSHGRVHRCLGNHRFEDVGGFATITYLGSRFL